MKKPVMESPNLEFRIALKYLIERYWKGREGVLANNAGISPAFLSRIKNSHKVASAQTQYQISKALKKPYEEILALGRALQSTKKESDTVNENITDYRCDNKANILSMLITEHQNLIESFQDKKGAYDLNRKLIEIEKKMPEAYEKIKEIVDIYYRDLKRKKRTVNG